MSDISPPSAPARLARLSPREVEVAERIRDGYKYQEIADQLFVSLATVKKHTYSIYRKLGVDNNRRLIQVMGTGTRDSDR